jgi:hypothetical protein
MQHLLMYENNIVDHQLHQYLMNENNIVDHQLHQYLMNENNIDQLLLMKKKTQIQQVVVCQLYDELCHQLQIEMKNLNILCL